MYKSSNYLVGFHWKTDQVLFIYYLMDRQLGYLEFSTFVVPLNEHACTCLHMGTRMRVFLGCVPTRGVAGFQFC